MYVWDFCLDQVFQHQAVLGSWLELDLNDLVLDFWYIQNLNLVKPVSKMEWKLNIQMFTHFLLGPRLDSFYHGQAVVHFFTICVCLLHNCLHKNGLLKVKSCSNYVALPVFQFPLPVGIVIGLLMMKGWGQLLCVQLSMKQCQMYNVILRYTL